MKSLTEINLNDFNAEVYFPSPTAWEDQVFYFLMLDRFSDGNEKNYLDINGNPVTSGTTSPYSTTSSINNPNYNQNGNGWKGGTLKGLETKIGYLKRLGITAIWISPILKQFEPFNTYHGYGIQDFLEIDHHFGNKADLQDLIKTAHDNGIYVILDIIFNHTADIFGYINDRNWFPKWDGTNYTIQGYRDSSGNATIPFNSAINNQDIGIWPVELQSRNAFTCKGNISNWNYDPEYLEGDFCGLKDLNLGDNHAIDNYVPSNAMRYLCEIYKYWVAFSDIDGFRIDTVKHMSVGAVRYFTSVIKEFAQNIGKENFFLLGEITGGRQFAYEKLEQIGLDAALGIDDVQDKLEYLAKGYRNPIDYFSLFRNSLLDNKGSHVWYRNKVVTMVDDHDQIRKGKRKARFCADAIGKKMIIPVLGLNITSLGIPCIYYGSEQNFAGKYVQEIDGNDCFLRETMFGSDFGAFITQNMHFFLEDTDTYMELSKIIKIRKEQITLRRGRQYLREISEDRINFSIPQMISNEIRFIVPWSRIFNDNEILLAINTDYNNRKTAWVTIDNDLHLVGSKFKVIYSTDGLQIGQSFSVVGNNGKSIHLDVPPAGFVILIKE
jgi:glycosidase